MGRTVPIASLPIALRTEEAVEAACAADITWIADRVLRGMSVLVECDKELSLYLYLAVRARLARSASPPKLVVVDGRARGDDAAGRGNLPRMLEQLATAIRGSVDRQVLVLLHLDVLTTTHTGLTVEAREAIPLLYENPEAVLLGFRDPSFPIPKVIEGVFAARRALVGIPREALAKVLTQREARSMHASELDVFGLYKYVSGLNPVRCRRLFADLALRREATPGRPLVEDVYRDLRAQTAPADVELPNVDLEADIGGYAEVKARLSNELIDLVRRKDALTGEADIRALEELLPRGVIFHGPPGTGKTFFAKAVATALDATVIVVSGPELKSKWVGESEENLRRVFRQARQAAPAVIVFDELDAFAHARGTYHGSGVEHSMVNQLLTEMDGFRKNETVFVVGTTNFLESLDPALLRPGRFEFVIEIPAPDADDRRSIVEIYRKRLGLALSDDLVRHLVLRTEGLADREHGIPFSGDHLNAVCRALKRHVFRTGRPELTEADVDRALERRTRRPVVLSGAEERVIAVHEAGHALLAVLLPKATPPERISIAADVEGALGYVIRAARARPYAVTEAEMLAEICVGLGGQAAERLVLGEVSIGARSDLAQCTRLARSMVDEYGMSALGAQVTLPDHAPSEAHRAAMDAEVTRILEGERARAERLLSENLALHAALVEQLLAVKILDRQAVRAVLVPRP